MDRTLEDPSGGYDALAQEFIRRRSPVIGVATVREWASALPSGGTVLDLGCGPGVPISVALMEEGLQVYGIDASPAMVEAFRERLPRARVRCEPVEDSSFFGRSFDGVVAWGLLFLLPAGAQVALIQRVAAALEPGGSFLFTAPEPECTWTDVLTGRELRSLGAVRYREELDRAGLPVAGELEDEGGNHYCLARRRE